MPMKGVRCEKGNIPMDEHRKCMLTDSRPCQMTPDMLELMTEGNKEREQSGVKFSPSSLQGCQRREILQHDGDWYLDVEKGWSAMRGNLIHAIFETAKPWPGILGTIREHRFSTVVSTKHGPQILMGKPDVVVLDRVEDDTLFIQVYDYKSKSDIKHDLVEADRKHVNQINIYAWIAARELSAYILSNPSDLATHDIIGWSKLENWAGFGDKVVVERLEIEYMDMRKVRTFTSGVTKYAKGKMTKRTYPREFETLELAPISLHKSKSVERWISKRIEEVIDAQAEGLPKPLVGDDSYVCDYCPVRRACIDLGQAEGISMEYQERFR